MAARPARQPLVWPSTAAPSQGTEGRLEERANDLVYSEKRAKRKKRAGKKMHRTMLDQMAHTKNDDVARVRPRPDRRF